MVYKIDVYSAAWKKVKERELNAQIFDDSNVNEWLIHEFVLMQLSNARNPIAHTKTRWEVNLSWKKLYRQKGTGRARVWDAWSPIRRHWWVAFWPRNNANFQKDMPKMMRRKALLWSLILKVRDWEVVCLDKYPFDEIKTKNAVSTLSNLWLSEQKVLLVVPTLEDNVVKSFRNIENLKYLSVDYVNPYDLLTYKKVVFLEEAFDRLEQRFAK